MIRPSRPILLTVVVAACAPYLALKLSWLTGGSTGVREVGLMQTPLYVVANAVTLLMDALLIAVVVVLTGERGRRRPGRLLVGPAVLGLGLLLPVAIGAPLIGVLQLAGPPDPAADQGLAPWVYVVVYSGFVVQFVVLAIAVSVCLGRDAPVRERPTAAARPGAGAVLVLVPAAAGIGYVAGLLAWAAGSTVGLTAGDPLPRTARAFDALLAALAVAAAGLTLVVVRRRSTAQQTAILVVGMSVWTWSAYLLLVSLAAPGGEPAFTPIGTLVWVSGVLAGLGAAWRVVTTDRFWAQLIGQA